jgi:thiosulfate/3-mercaptopyruvate sulfurtransferase
MPFTTLIETEELAHQLSSPTLAVVDCRFALDDLGWGSRAYQEQHIPGAVFADVENELSGHKTGMNGRHPLPAESALRALLGRLGIDASVQVVAYDQDAGMYASRLWWLLKWQGHDAAAVLNGGFAKWVREGRPTEPGIATCAARHFHGTARPAMVVDADAVRGMLERGDGRVLDARAPERYRGEVEPIDKIAGHIPGAMNHPFKSNVDPSGVFKQRDELRAHLLTSTGGIAPGQVVNYCGSGVTACQNILAMEHAGLTGSKLYAGSWSEWSADPARPVATGE